MTLHSLTIPEDPAAWPAWLEDQLLSDHLADVVVELEILASSPRSSSQSLDEIIGSSWPQVLASGLGGLPPGVIRSLLSRPVLLLDLQERVCVEGGEYWTGRLDGSTTSMADQWSAMEARLQEKKGGLETGRVVSRSMRRWGRVVVGLATAAALLFAIWYNRPAPTPGWGFDKPGVLASASSERELIETLADAAHAWFNKTPQNSEQLVTRLEQFDQGCQTLLSAELAPLSVETRRTVKDACRDCRQQISEHLAALRSGGDFDTIRQSANKTIERLELKIRGATG